MKIVVVPSGRLTKTGAIIFKAAPTETDVRREVAEKRVQTFRHGKKVSDTLRVKVTRGGEEVFVKPEEALATGTTAQREEARTKIKRREQLESTIRARFEREVREAETLTERKIAEKKGIKLIEKERVKGEAIKPKRPVELFSPLARQRLGISETPEGLLEVRKGERKVIVERGEIRAEIPLTAEFRTGFERQIGTGIERERLVGLKTPSGILTFKTIEEPISRKLKEVFEPSFEFFKGEQLKLRRELKGRPSIIEDRQFKKLGLQELRTIQLRAGQLVFGGEVGLRKQIAEQPLETAAIITTGAVFGVVAAKPVIAKAAAFRISSALLGTAFVGVTGVQVGVQIRRGRFAEAGEIIGERSAEALLFIGAGKVATMGVKGFKRIKFERGIKRFEKGLPKFTEQELRTRLGTGGIKTRQPKEIQTTFDIEPRVKTAKEALRIRIFEKAKAPLKRPQPPTRIAIIETEVSDILQTPPKILTLERTGKFDISAFGEAPKQFTRLRIRIGRLGDIIIRDIGIQKALVKPTAKTGRFRILPEPPKLKTSIVKPPKSFVGKPAKTLDVGRLATQQISGTKLVIIEPTLERPRIDITQFGGREIIPKGIITPKVTVRARIPIRTTIPIIGKLSDLVSREAQDIISGQKLRTRLEVSQKSQQDLASDLERITGTKPKPAFDIATGLISVQDISQVQEQEQLIITIPKPRVPGRGRPDVPLPFEPPFPPPTPPPPFLFLPKPRLFLGDPIKRKKKPLRPQFGFTPGFMSAVLGEFGPPPKPGQRFTGQERRFIIKGKPFLTPLPKRREGIVQLVVRQLGG